MHINLNVVLHYVNKPMIRDKLGCIVECTSTFKIKILKKITGMEELSYSAVQSIAGMCI